MERVTGVASCHFEATHGAPIHIYKRIASWMLANVLLLNKLATSSFHSVIEESETTSDTCEHMPKFSFRLSNIYLLQLGNNQIFPNICHTNGCTKTAAQIRFALE